MTTLYSTFYLIQQLSFAVAGATAFWSFLFLFRRSLIGRELAKRLFLINFGALFLGLLGYLARVLSHAGVLHAHEGLVIIPARSEFLSGLFIDLPLVVALAVMFIIAAFLFVRKRALLWRYLDTFYFLEIAIVAFLISLPAWRGQLDNEQLFYVGHNVHSIMTFGTVIVLDVLFTLSLKYSEYRNYLFGWFGTISKVIWAGLFIDFLSVALVFNDALKFNSKTFFIQFVVGILIINGAILSGPITRLMIEGRPISKKLRFSILLCGAISFGSWSTMYIADFYEKIRSVPIYTLIGIYLLYIVGLYFIYSKFEKSQMLFANNNTNNRE